MQKSLKSKVLEWFEENEGPVRVGEVAGAIGEEDEYSVYLTMELLSRPGGCLELLALGRYRLREKPKLHPKKPRNGPVRNLGIRPVQKELAGELRLIRIESRRVLDAVRRIKELLREDCGYETEVEAEEGVRTIRALRGKTVVHEVYVGREGGGLFVAAIGSGGKLDEF